MTTAISSTNTSLAVVPKTIDEVNDLAERFSKSSLLPKSMQGKAADVLVTIMAGAEMGLSPMASLRAIHVIEGRPVLSADGMAALVLGSGRAKYLTRVEESDTSVTYETCRVGTETPRRCTWTIEMSKRAGLHLKDNWRAHPRAMLAARAKAELARDVYPDVLMGCYTMDEIEASAPATVHQIDVVDAEIVDLAAEAIDAINKAESVEAVRALSKGLSKLSEPARSQAKEAYKARLAFLENTPKTTNGVHAETAES